MTWGAIGAAAVGTVGGALLNRSSGNRPTQTTSGTSSGSTATSNYGQGTYAPNPAAMPMYGFLAGNTQNIMQLPRPFFPGQTYVGPSGPTQQGVNMGMGSMPYYQGAAEGYGQAGLFGAQGMDMFGGAANMYGGAGALAPWVSNQYGKAGAAYGNAMPGQQRALGTAESNYGFLSNAADVANNPYVNAQADAITQRVNQNFKENIMPTINGGANAVNALGSSRHGVAQAQGAERSQQQLANELAGLYGNAYGQGLNAQQSALGQLGNVQQGFSTIGDTAARAAAMGERGMGAMGQGADYLSRGGQQYGFGADQLARAAGYGERGGEALRRGADASMGYGQTVEGYQKAALDDAMARWAHQYEEPWQRMQNTASMLGMSPFYSIGVQQGAGGGMSNSTGMQPNPGYMSPYQAMAGGAQLGYGIYDQYRQSQK